MKTKSKKPKPTTKFDTTIKLRNKACGAIGEYLEAHGWKTVEDPSDTGFFQVIDPRHGNSHRPDFAFIIQTDRDLEKTYRTWLKKQKPKNG